jgi:hypothetical protein
VRAVKAEGGRAVALVADGVKGLAVWIENNLDRILAARAQQQTKP